MHASPHFTWHELRDPPEEYRPAMLRLCYEVLEPIRDLLKVPIAVTSGWRSKESNAACNGAKHSQHLVGQAVDIRPIGVDPEDAFALIVNEIREGRLVVDQAIIYASGFFHFSYREGNNRNQVLRSYAMGGSGGPYVPYAGKKEGK